MGTLHGHGDAINGERIMCTCKKIGKPGLFHRTNTHRGQRVVLTGGVHCVIEKELKMISNTPEPDSM